MAAGLIAGIVSGLLGMSADAPGLFNVSLDGVSLVWHLLAAIPLGGLCGTLFGYQPRGYAASISGGLLFGLMLWIIGPLTLAALTDDAGPSWSASDAFQKFPSVFVHMVYGGLTGLLTFVSAAFYVRTRPISEEPASQTDVTRVVIVGGGFGGIAVATRLERIFWRDPNFEVAMISQSNYLLFTPMLAEVAGSALEPQHISAPVRAALPRTRFIRADVLDIHTDTQTLHYCASDSDVVESLDYSHLVLALGSVPNFFGLPGMEEHSISLKSLEDATNLRNHVITQLEMADVNPDPESRHRQLTFVVAGGGFAGTETIAEISDLVTSVLRYYPNIERSDLQFVLVHSRDRILPELGPDLANYARDKLEARGIEFVLEARVSGATEDGVQLADGREIPSHTIVWTAGNQPNPLLQRLESEKSRSGAVAVESSLNVKGFSNVWAVGDCAQIPVPDAEGEFYPPTAQHAIREGKLAARNIAATIRGKPTKPFRFQTLGTLVPLGHHTGAAEIRGLKFSGLLAWLMWRGIYLTLLPGLEKKVRVLFDWTIDLFFPRDTVLTSGGRQTPLPAIPPRPVVAPSGGANSDESPEEDAS
ncbi:MAG: NAD(P)/FAD-dependent oxidoreductase [SAR202 cluster bacterium]|nr:NAD(P)/FAD-dependent oxidoreductase [SAR202 cluster bacterium]MDP6714552.1 NAD(P)/FAD-dependent oxidoreductase [SAR202 cluster bacterium]